MKDKDKERSAADCRAPESVATWRLSSFDCHVATSIDFPDAIAISCTVHANLIYSSRFFPGHTPRR
jgi:hypothetical protein